MPLNLTLTLVLFELPLAIIGGAGLVVAFRRWSEYSQVCLLAAMGSVFLIIAAIAGSATLFLIGGVFGEQIPGTTSVSISLLNLATTLSLAIGVGLIIIAVFVERPIRGVEP